MIDLTRLAIALLTTRPAIELLRRWGEVGLTLHGWTLRAGLLNPHSGTELVIRLFVRGTTIDHVVRGRFDDDAPTGGYSVAVEIWKGVVTALADDTAWRCSACGCVVIPDDGCGGCPLCEDRPDDELALAIQAAMAFAEEAAMLDEGDRPQFAREVLEETGPAILDRFEDDSRAEVAALVAAAGDTPPSGAVTRCVALLRGLAERVGGLSAIEREQLASTLYDAFDLGRHLKRTTLGLLAALLRELAGVAASEAA